MQVSLMSFKVDRPGQTPRVCIWAFLVLNPVLNCCCLPQDYANTTDTVKMTPITLVVALPSAPSSIEANATAKGPVPPYYLDAPCRSVMQKGHNSHKAPIIKPIQP
jgi:hypothetical protein